MTAFSTLHPAPNASAAFESFEGFKAYIRRTFIEKSGIDAALFDACVTFHQDIELTDGNDVETPIHDALGWHYTRFGAKANGTLYAAFLMNEDGSLWQAVVSVWDEDKQRHYRYFAPTANGDRAFLPPVPPTIRRRIGDRFGISVPEDGSFWEWVKGVNVPRLLTEGGKKGLSGLSHGYITIALYGCTCGVSTKDEEQHTVEPYLIKDLEQFATFDQQWLFAFDRDTKPTAIRAVAHGKKRLRQALSTVGCVAADIIWRGEEDGKGMDDFIIEKGSGAFDAAYAKAISLLERQFTSRARSDQPTPIPKADILAAEIVEDYRDIIVWNNAHRTWLKYELTQAGVWGMVDDHYVDTLIHNVLKARGIRGYGTDAYITNIRKFLSRELVTFTWEERKGVLPFEDGVVSIDTVVFAPHSPQNRLTWCLPRQYETSLMADWGTIRAWFEEAWKDERDREMLLCFAAAVIRGRYDLQKFLYLVGTGGSGKGTYTRLLQAVIGERNVWAGKIESLNDKNDCARLVGKPLAVFADQDKVTGGLQLFKNLTGQDDITAKRLYKDGFNFIFQGLALITANAPALLGAGSWMKRRAIVVNCNHQPTKERNLDVEFAPEIAAFTRYLLSISNERIDQVLRDERPTSGAVAPAYWEMAQRQDSIVAWLEECVVCDPQAFTAVGKNKDEWREGGYTPELSTLFGSYHHFCRHTGLQGKSLTNFSPELEELCQKVLSYPFVQRTRNSQGIRGFQGLRLRRETEPHISDNLVQATDNHADNQTDNQKSLPIKDSDNPDNLLTKIIPNNLSSVQSGDNSPPKFPPHAPPVTAITSPITIENGCQGCQSHEENHGIVKDVASDNPDVVLLSANNTSGDCLPEEAVPPALPTPGVPSWVVKLCSGSLVRFQHDDFDGWRNGVIQEVVAEAGVFVHAVVKANIKKRGVFVERTYTVGRMDWLQPRG
ncbi:DUF3854 domain-containing protein [Calothrix sp. FACHB-1219]|uniref:DUF3854 domain-containing protein n=1 Tax=unclassified Calothrix TaxID=2619626 RepID=UPI001684D2B9|nr:MULTISPECIES: DUF3854 domain-containing protein [unclassified Calothrix]MBD2207603.1 DUF3854 domain-containing protein [Calothrix sp. FACHB-168]MBD2222204.1 DUF3854 domain-containing protein [Calothrix sp. FACHB-1219]